MTSGPLFDRIRWRDPVSGLPLTPLVQARTPAGVPLHGALQVAGTDRGYPIVDCVARLTPESAHRYAEWLGPYGLEPPEMADRNFQAAETVESFGFQWAWNSAMRSPEDLLWRVATRFALEPGDFAGQRALDAGAGAGDQSRWLLDHGASVVSVDLSDAIDVVAAKLRMRPDWFGVQGDLTRLPFEGEQFSLVYCEGVIQHTRDSALTVVELCRVLEPGGRVLATHYDRSPRLLGRLKLGVIDRLRRHAGHMDRFKLLLYTGNLAALAHIPVIGALVSRTGLAVRYSLMPDFKTTWTNTFDQYGSHAYQRYVGADEFLSYFDRAGGMAIEHNAGTLVVARKHA